MKAWDRGVEMTATKKGEKFMTGIGASLNLN